MGALPVGCWSISKLFTPLQARLINRNSEMFYLHQSYPPGFPLKAAVGNQPRKKESHSFFVIFIPKQTEDIAPWRRKRNYPKKRIWCCSSNIWRFLKVFSREQNCRDMIIFWIAFELTADQLSTSWKIYPNL